MTPQVEKILVELTKCYVKWGCCRMPCKKGLDTPLTEKLRTFEQCWDCVRNTNYDK